MYFVYLAALYFLDPYDTIVQSIHFASVVHSAEQYIEHNYAVSIGLTILTGTEWTKDAKMSIGLRNYKRNNGGRTQTQALRRDALLPWLTNGSTQVRTSGNQQIKVKVNLNSVLCKMNQT
jgi:hypothetical protein